MSEPGKQPDAVTGFVSPALPDVESLPAEDVIDGVPSAAEIIERAESAADIVGQQPDVEELLGRGRSARRD